MQPQNENFDLKAENQEKALDEFNFEVLESRLELSRWFTKTTGAPPGPNSGSVGINF